MREILFRGKRLDTGGWVYGYYCKHIKRQVCPMGDELKPEDIAHLVIDDGFADWNMPRSLQGYDVDPETVGQYTGLKDEYGQGIYEGDICKYRYGRWTYIGKVVFNTHACIFEMRRTEIVGSHGERAIKTQLLNHIDKVEVIGNIYDNPEMLEVF